MVRYVPSQHKLMMTLTSTHFPFISSPIASRSSRHAGTIDQSFTANGWARYFPLCILGANVV
ncbi:hypothetical protein K443DRAFT_677979 [Laccaria amethystina LaAM-08-1]|uniref:Uncharacterized protein n=1 Tax=Laccaria amethystina LaAM-08-1 TaxID=1095629 RepID=A0A0C9XAP2_9AGAR|nr:hypothetical protein K443DRAFT_677979 [Laccaria amethystina LaAM-08-1]